jgi:chromate transporter
MERLEQVPALQSALAAITAAVVGVIANLTLWFALHVLFAHGELAGFDWRAGAIALLAAALLFGWKRGVFTVLALSAVAGLVLGQM